ncbi:MAG: DUF1330 domain-containing protein [Clostridia bacterium]|jgi:uncharacterized protein (DUF1330 family)|nr:DUF1330 domain-containing protein [Clostridia bacterium]
MAGSPVYAFNFFNVTDKNEYLTYVKNSATEVARHNGKVIAVAKFREAIAGDGEPRQIFVLVEWATNEDFENYRNDPTLTELHSHRLKGTSDYLWYTLDKLENFRFLKD